MSAGFETSESHVHARLKPLRVALRAENLFEEARAMVADLAGWQVASCDEANHVLVCRRPGGWLHGNATITITCSGPEGLPSAVVHVRSVTPGGVLRRDRANVLAFMTRFHRRVC